MAADPREQGPRPDEDPYEFDWPDDSKDQRAAERDAARKAASRPHAGRVLTAWVLGVSTQLIFFGVVLGVAGEPNIFAALILPTVVVATVVALPLGFVLGRVSENWRAGFGEATFLAVGMAFGFAWGWSIVTYFPQLFTNDLDFVEQARAVVAIFLLTSVGSSFFIARIATDVVRRSQLAVRIMLATIAALTAWSIASFVATAL